MKWFMRKSQVDHSEAALAKANAAADLREARHRWSEVEKISSDRGGVHDLFAAEIIKMIRENV